MSWDGVPDGSRRARSALLTRRDFEYRLIHFGALVSCRNGVRHRCTSTNARPRRVPPINTNPSSGFAGYLAGISSKPSEGCEMGELFELGRVGVRRVGVRRNEPDRFDRANPMPHQWLRRKTPCAEQHGPQAQMQPRRCLPRTEQ